MVDKVALLETWYQALRVEVGLRVKTSNARSLMVRMYEIRAEAKDPQLEALTLRIDKGDVLIVHKQIKVKVEGTPDGQTQT